jgi:hypothetical protein
MNSSTNWFSALLSISTSFPPIVSHVAYRHKNIQTGAFTNPVSRTVSHPWSKPGFNITTKLSCLLYRKKDYSQEY